MSQILFASWRASEANDLGCCFGVGRRPPVVKVRIAALVMTRERDDADHEIDQRDEEEYRRDKEKDIHSYHRAAARRIRNTTKAAASNIITPGTSRSRLDPKSPCFVGVIAAALRWISQSSILSAESTG